MSLRHKIESALNLVHIALRKSSDYADDAAGIVDDATLAALLRDLARRRQDQARRLETQIRKVGFPQMPDPERQLVGKSIQHLKAALVKDRDAALLKAQHASEKEIAESCAAATRMDLPEEIARWLGRLKEDAVQQGQDLDRLVAS
jgi:hypothetical protein